MTAASLWITPFGIPFDTAVIAGMLFVLLAVVLSALGTGSSAGRDTDTPEEHT